MTKIRSIALIGTALCALPPAAQAGFEFMPSMAMHQQAPVDAAAPLPIAPVEQQDTMPSMPAIPVTSQPLPPIDMTPPPQPAANEVYIPRAPSQSPIPMKAAAGNGELVINPYPLQARNIDVTHSNDGVYVEQAMMQEAGALRGIAAPGANYTSQITNNAQNLALTKGPKVYAQAPVTAPNNYGGLTPMMGGEVAPMGAAAPVISAAPLAPVPMRQPQPAPVAPSVSGFEEAVGFGKELPLALALSQVVPSDYSFSFAQNVNVGSSVSWQGGKSWDAVLQEMLAPVGMKAVISGKQVVIQNAA